MPSKSIKEHVEDVQSNPKEMVMQVVRALYVLAEKLNADAGVTDDDYNEALSQINFD